MGERIGKLDGDVQATLERGKTGWELAKGQPVQGRLDADVPDLSTIAAWLGPDAQMGGRMNAHVTVSGTGAEPRLAGEARAENVTLREPQSGFELQQGIVAVRMDGRTVTVDRLEATTPWHPSRAARLKLDGAARSTNEGRITAQGSIDLTSHKGSLRVRADKAALTQTNTRFLAVTGDAQLEGAGEGM